MNVIYGATIRVDLFSCLQTYCYISFLFPSSSNKVHQFEKVKCIFRNGSNGREDLKMFDRFLNQLTYKLAVVYKIMRPPPTKSEYTRLEPVEQDFINYIYMLSKTNVSTVRIKKNYQTKTVADNFKNKYS